jgi:decaprenylphospho-beta-D-erythro-pentofuranosid-2-ulose 2-reductase
MNGSPRRVAIFGATSAIAQAVARVYARGGAHFALVARHPERLRVVAADLAVRGGTVALETTAELTELSRHAALVEAAVEALGGIDVALVAHGVLPDQEECRSNAQAAVDSWNVNFVSAASLMEALATRMAPGTRGVLAVLSSVAGERGRAKNYVYGAAKAALTTYASGLGQRLHGSGLAVVTVKPGPVETPMTAGRGFEKRVLADVDAVGAQIHRALERRKRVVYVPGRWRWVFAVIRLLPVRLFERLGF